MNLSLTLISAIFTLGSLAGCALPPVNLTTTEPVKVDINVRLDVYQHKDKKAAAVSTSQQSAGKNDIAAVKKRSRDRMGDIQVFKNNRVVGENHLGLLEIRKKPPGEWGEYIASTVSEENKDRSLLMTAKVAADNSSLEVVRNAQAKLRRSQAFNGEWIETENSSGQWIWQQKGK